MKHNTASRELFDRAGAADVVWTTEDKLKLLPDGLRAKLFTGGRQPGQPVLLIGGTPVKVLEIVR